MRGMFDVDKVRERGFLRQAKEDFGLKTSKVFECSSILVHYVTRLRYL